MMMPVESAGPFSIDAPGHMPRGKSGRKENRNQVEIKLHG